MKEFEHNGFIIEEVEPSETMKEIGRLRYDVWADEGEIDKNLFPDKIWLDKNDPISRHWVVYPNEKRWKKQKKRRKKNASI